MQNSEESNHSPEFKRYTGPNPFQTRTPIGFYETCKIIFFTITFIAPLRALLAALILLSMWPDVLIASVGHNQNEPLGCVRKLATYVIRFKMRITLFVLGVYYIPIIDHNSAKDFKRNANIIVANHVSLLDAIPIIIRHGCSAAAKKEVFKMPFIGSLMRAFQGIPIDRSSSEGRRAAIKQLANRCSDPRLPPLLIFPEGTTSVDNVLTLFKPGPFIAGKPVQPVVIRFPNHYHDMLLKGGVKSLYRLCCQFVNNMSYEYLSEYVPSAEEKANPQLFASNVRALMAKTMGAMTTEHSFEDSQFLKKAKASGVPVDFELDPLGKVYMMKYKDLIPLLRRFRALDTDGNSVIDFEDFCSITNIKPTSDLRVPAEAVFKLLDKDNDGVLNFGDFVMSIAVFSSKCSPEESAKALFAVCDLNADGSVNRADMERIIELATTKQGTAFELPEEKKGGKKKAESKEVKIDIKASSPTAETGVVSDQPPSLNRLYSVKFAKSYQETVSEFFIDTESLNQAQFIERSLKHPEVATKLLGLFLHKYVVPNSETVAQAGVVANAVAVVAASAHVSSGTAANLVLVAADEVTTNPAPDTLPSPTPAPV